LPLLFRRVGETAWLEGITDNLSRSGVLFRTECPPENGAAVELTLVLRRRQPYEELDVVVHGQVVRTVDASEGVPAGVAMHIHDYRMRGESR
jgi:hypothetical protein